MTASEALRDLAYTYRDKPLPPARPQPRFSVHNAYPCGHSNRDANTVRRDGKRVCRWCNAAGRTATP